MARYTALLVLLALSAAHCDNAATSLGSLLGWQQHSWDDIKEWRASIVKGSWVFKIDFNFVPEEFCAQQPHVPKPVDPRGCMLLVHTATEVGVGQAGPWSSTDVLKYLADPANIDLFNMSTRHKLFAINFKSMPSDPCDGSYASNSWLSLLDDFYNNAIAIIDTAKLNVEFYWDQLLPPFAPCLMNRWTRWVSTWDQDPPYDSRLYSSNPANYTSRYQVFNKNFDPTQISNLANNKWFKFGNNNSYPLVVYEPSDEQAIKALSDIYLGSGVNHTAGYLVAWNPDPVQYTLYASSRSLKALHQQITHDLAYNYSTQPSQDQLVLAYSWPQVTTLDTSANHDGSSFVMLTVYVDNTNQARYITHAGNAPQKDSFADAPPPAVVFSNYTVLNNGSLPSNGGPSDRFSSISSFYLNSTAYVVLGDVNNNYYIYTLDTKSGSLSLVNASSFPNLPQVNYERAALSALPLPGLAGLGSQAVAFVQANTGYYDLGGRCTAWLQLMAIDFSKLGSNGTQGPVNVGPPVCLSMHPGASMISVAAIKAMGRSRCLRSPIYGNTSAIEVFVAYGNQFGTIQVGLGGRSFMAQACLDTNYGGASNMVYPIPTVNPPVFTVGDFPYITAMAVPGQDYAMVFMANTNGYCANSEEKDDSPFGYPQTCSAYEFGFAHSMVGVLQYTYGRNDDFARRLAASSNSSGSSQFVEQRIPIATPCDAQLLHGVYDQGYQPTIALISTPTGILANEVHVGLQSVAMNDCGSPEPADGLVLDAFILATPSPYLPANTSVSISAIAAGTQSVKWA